MRTLLFILLFSVSLTAQEKKGNATQNVFITTIDGKSSLDAPIEMTRNELYKSAVSLQARNTGQTVPKVIALEVFVPGHPAIQIKGDKLDEETKNKINSLKDGNAVAIRGLVAKISAEETLDYRTVPTSILLKG